MGFGKVFHHQDPVSYSVPKYLPKSYYAYPIYGKSESVELQRSLPVSEKGEDWWGYQEGRNTRWIRALSWEDPDVPQENINIALQPESSELSRKLKAQFDGGWQAALP